MAGEIGIDPTHLTLRKLAWMYEGRHQFAETVDKLGWRQSLSLIAAVRNTTATKKTEYLDPMTFFPYGRQSQSEPAKEKRVTSGIALTSDNCVSILTSLFGIKADD